MLKLKVTEEYRVDTENEAKEAMENFRQRAAQEGYTLNSCGYTHKEKKSKGEIVDEGYLLKVVKVFGGFWDWMN